MGRRKLYHTPEEKAIANRTKSRRHYERCKTDINQKRRSIYRRAARKQRTSTDTAVLKQMVQPPETAHNPIDIWMERGERVRKRFEKLTHGSAFEFVNNLCQQFLHDNDKERLHVFSTKLGGLRDSIYQYQQEVLQLDGCGGNYQRLEDIVKNVRGVLDCVDELWVLAMVDSSEVRQLYDNLELLYQRS